MDQVNSFAIVAYVDGPIARFAGSLRDELHPGSTDLPHITILPPRPLAGPPAEGILFARQQVAKFEPFGVELRTVELFPDTQVIYLSVGAGARELALMNAVLNTGALEQPEIYPYLPHLTLGKHLAVESVAPGLGVARRRWEDFGPPPPLRIDTVTFVQQQDDGVWTDLAELGLGRVPAVG